METFEIKSSNAIDRQEIRELFSAKIEVLDESTFNADVRSSDVEGLTDYLDEAGLEYRLV